MSEVVCASCGSQQVEGSAYCALCGRQFPRMGWLDESGDRAPVVLSQPAAAISPAGVGRRFLAAVVDCLASVLAAGLIVGIGFLVVGPVTDQWVAAFLPYGVGSAVMGLGVAIGQWIWQGRTGGTLGNTMMKIRIVDQRTYAPTGVARASLWWVLLGLSNLVPVLGPVLVLLSPSFDVGVMRQGWLDKITKAVAIDLRDQAGPISAASALGFGQVDPDPWPASQGSAFSQEPDVWSFTPGTQASAVSQGQQLPPDPFFEPAFQAAPGYPAPSNPPMPAFAWPETAQPSGVPPVSDPWASSAPVFDGLMTDVSAVSAPVAPNRPGAHMEAAPVAPIVLHLESGKTIAVTGPTLIGRSPQPPDAAAWVLVPLADPTRSVSKTHLQLGVDGDGLWVVDRGSTNGTILSAPGRPPQVVEPGVRARVPIDSTIHLGDRKILVRAGVA